MPVDSPPHSCGDCARLPYLLLRKKEGKNFALAFVGVVATGVRKI